MGLLKAHFLQFMECLQYKYITYNLIWSVLMLQTLTMINICYKMIIKALIYTCTCATSKVLNLRIINLKLNLNRARKYFNRHCNTVI